ALARDTLFYPRAKFVRSRPASSTRFRTATRPALPQIADRTVIRALVHPTLVDRKGKAHAKDHATHVFETGHRYRCGPACRRRFLGRPKRREEFTATRLYRPSPALARDAFA